MRDYQNQKCKKSKIYFIIFDYSDKEIIYPLDFNYLNYKFEESKYNKSVSDYKIIFKNGAWGVNEAVLNLCNKYEVDSDKIKDWTYNHYCLILVKMSGIIRHFPELFETLWSPVIVLDQVYKRYEFNKYINYI